MPEQRQIHTDLSIVEAGYSDNIWRHVGLKPEWRTALTMEERLDITTQLPSLVLKEQATLLLTIQGSDK